MIGRGHLCNTHPYYAHNTHTKTCTHKDTHTHALTRTRTQIECGSTPECLIQTIVAALEMGLPELKRHCLRTLADGITAETVCSILTSAHTTLGCVTEEEEGEEGEEGSVVSQVEQCCADYIEANTRAVFKSKGFLQLPKETLLSIIQSSKVCV